MIDVDVYYALLLKCKQWVEWRNCPPCHACLFHACCKKWLSHESSELKSGQTSASKRSANYFKWWFPIWNYIKKLELKNKASTNWFLWLLNARSGRVVRQIVVHCTAAVSCWKCHRLTWRYDRRWICYDILLKCKQCTQWRNCSPLTLHAMPACHDCLMRALRRRVAKHNYISKRTACHIISDAFLFFRIEKTMSTKRFLRLSH